MPSMDTDFYETLGVPRNADGAAIKDKSQALTDLAMKMGQAIYEKDQAAAASPGGEGGAESAEAAASDEEVVDAEFSEVDEDNKG